MVFTFNPSHTSISDVSDIYKIDDEDSGGGHARDQAWILHSKIGLSRARVILVPNVRLFPSRVWELHIYVISNLEVATSASPFLNFSNDKAVLLLAFQKENLVTESNIG